MSKQDRKPLGGVVHSYQRYDPTRLPSPTAEPPDIAGAAMEHMLMFGSMRTFTDEELAEAIHIDPSQIAGFGPSLDALIAMLEERKRKILETYETDAAVRAAHAAFADETNGMQPPAKVRNAFERAVRGEQLAELERLWYAAEQLDKPFANALLRAIETLGDAYEIDALDSAYDFTGETPMDVPKALAIKEELETIDRLLEQLREALKNAKPAIVDMDELRRFVDEAQVDQLQEFGRQIQDMIDAAAAEQGVERSAEGYQLSPKAVKLFQSSVLREIFSTLQASRSGRHEGPISGDGAVEMAKTRPYDFGDSVGHLDVGQSLVNAVLREAARPSGDNAVRVTPEDLEIHETRNRPKAATCVLIDMSGSMRHGGQYIASKRMALGLDGLIRSEYPGDFLRLIEIYSFARVVPTSELPGLMPKPVTIHDPWVRLRVDMSREDITEGMVHPHFTNIQRGLQLARMQLAAQDTPNRQVMLITDGLPTAHFEGEHLYLLYPPDPLTEEATMREAAACAREGITINIFLVPSWSQSSEDIAFAHRVAETTRGRVFFTGGADLDRFVLWDYVNQRRRMIG